MRFKLKSSLDNSSFTGRDNELTRLSSFLANELGGTLLIAGERGAGKSTLVRHTLKKLTKELHHKFSPLRLTRSSMVTVELPYLPKHLAEMSNQTEDKKAQLTSLILRALAQTLASENNTRIHKKVDIRKSWFRPIGYTRDLKELDRLTRFSEIKENNDTSLKVKMMKLDLGGTRNTSYIHDLSDTILEVRLRKLLTTYSGQLKFVFVFDELDKLVKSEGKQLDVLDFVYYLKNLFTHSGAHFIFITTDSVYLSLERDIALNPYSTQHTLFTEKFLLNNLHPEDYLKWVTSFFDTGKESVSLEFYRMVYAAGWHTKQHPYDTFNLLRRAQVRTDEDYYVDTDMLDGSFDALTWTYYSTMQSFIDFIFTKHKDSNDNHFNQILYRSVRTAGQYVIFGKQQLISRRSFLTALFITDDFPGASEELNAKARTPFSGVPEYTYQPEDWRDSINYLSANQRARIEVAIQDLYFLLNREGSLQLAFTSEMPEDNDMMTVNFVGDAFSLSNLRVAFYEKDGFKSYYNPTENMKQDLKKSLKVNSRFKAMFGSDVWDFYGSHTVESPSMNRNGQLELSTNYRYLLKPDIDKYHESLSSADQAIEDKVVEQINSAVEATFNDPPHSQRKPTFAKRENGSYETNLRASANSLFRIVFNASDPSDATLNSTNEHYINLKYDPRLKKAKRYFRDSWRDFGLGDNLQNLNKVVPEIVEHIKKILQA